MFFYTQREVVLYTDGSFAYKGKNKTDKIKLMVSAENITKVDRKNQVLTITLKGDPVKLRFKFSTV